MTDQEIFDKVVAHLRKQGHKSMSEKLDAFTQIPICAYRAANGDMCAVGCLIENSEYKESFEGVNAMMILDGGYGADISLVERLYPHRRLLNDLQIVHDKMEVKDWEWGLARVAASLGLIYTPLPVQT